MSPTSHTDSTPSRPDSSDEQRNTAWHDFLSRGSDRPPKPHEFDINLARRYLARVSRLSLEAQQHIPSDTSSDDREDFEGSLLLRVERSWLECNDTSRFEDWMMQTARELLDKIQSRGHIKSSTVKTEKGDCPGAYVADFLARGLPPFPFLFDQARALRYLKRTWGIMYNSTPPTCRVAESEQEDLHMECIGRIEDKWPQYDPHIARFQTWVHTVAKNLAIDKYCDDERQNNYIATSQGGASITRNQRSIDDGAVDDYYARLTKAYGRAIQDMSTRELDVLDMTMRHTDRTDTEIGTSLGLSEVQVKNARAQAFKKLRGNLDFCELELQLADARARSAQRRFDSDPDSISFQAEKQAATNWLHRALRNFFVHLKDADDEGALRRASEVGTRLLPLDQIELADAQQKLSDQQRMADSGSLIEADREKANKRISSLTTTVKRLQDEISWIRAAIQRWECEDV